MMPYPLAILAGGLATRLRPITETIAKSMAPVCGEPFVSHQLRLVHKQGFRRVVMCIGHYGEQIREYVGDGHRYGLAVTYSEDGDRPLGTGGALAKALPQLGERLAIIYGDSYLDFDAAAAAAAFEASGLPALMTVFHNRDRWHPSNVHFADDKVVRHDKTAGGQPGVEWIDYGMTFLDAFVIRECSLTVPFDLSDVTRRLAERGLLGGFEVVKRFYEIGRQESLDEASRYIGEKMTHE